MLFPQPPVPKALRPWFILPCSLALTESLSSPPSRQPVGRHSTSSSSRSPQRRQSRQPFRGASCSRLTPVPLTGFPNLSADSADVFFAALFRAATVPGISLQRVPLARSAHPSRGHCSLAVIHPPAELHRRRLITDPFTDTHALWRSSLDPGPTMSFLSTNPEGPTSESLWAQAANSPLSASFTCYEAFFLSRVRSLTTRVASRRWPIRSWVSPSPEPSPTTPRSLDPPDLPEEDEHGRRPASLGRERKDLSSPKATSTPPPR